MGWFDDQIEERKKQEDELLSDSFQSIARSVTGYKINSEISYEGMDINDALNQLLKYFHIRKKEIPGKLKDLEDKLDYLLSSTGILYREIKLEKGWHHNAMGVMMASLQDDGSVITLVPGDFGGYIYIDPHTGKKIKVTRSIEKKIGTEAWCFYRSFPMRKLSVNDLVKYMIECLNGWDYFSFIMAALSVVLVGMLIPKLQNILMSQVVSLKSDQLLFAVMSFLFFATIGNLLFTVIREVLLERIKIKLTINMEASTMMRVLALPADFFRNYSAGELNKYLQYMNSLSATIIETIFSTGLTGLFSLVFITQIFQFAPSLVWPALIVTFITLGVSVFSANLKRIIGKEQMKLEAKEHGITFSLISGIQKIRLSGAENRAFSRWANLYAEESALTYRPPILISLNTVITQVISLIGTMVMYYIAIKTSVSVADYYSFNASYAYIQTAFTSIATVALSAATIKPIFELIHPLLDSEPEEDENLETVTSLSGNIMLSHVSFRYEKESPFILDDISINIPARQYIAIVGKTGCGKSTLMRLLLGFEHPTKGSIFYDKRDVKSLNMRSVRKQIGTVLQNGRVFNGSIFENITISDPTLTVDDAWEAAKIAGLDEIIEDMPMGMHTMISEGGGGISGGQRQRLMIARAVAPTPKILLLDEATSALDNITQKKVSEALDQMKCTRIVIAHRLSTIRHCDRILVLDHGKIIEDGTYEELIELNGFFAELVARQRVDI